MINDKIQNCESYYGISKRLKDGFEWLKSQDLNNIECGKYEIDGKSLYANVQEYETKSEANFETHKNYADIQYMIKGKELIGYSEKTNCTTCIKYDPNTDLEFMTCNAEELYLPLREGEFFVFFPQDAHKPSMDYCEKSIVKKVVVKVALS